MQLPVFVYLTIVELFLYIALIFFERGMTIFVADRCSTALAVADPAAWSPFYCCDEMLALCELALGFCDGGAAVWERERIRCAAVLMSFRSLGKSASRLPLNLRTYCDYLDIEMDGLRASYFMLNGYFFDCILRSSASSSTDRASFTVVEENSILFVDLTFDTLCLDILITSLYVLAAASKFTAPAAPVVADDLTPILICSACYNCWEKARVLLVFLGEFLD